MKKYNTAMDQNFKLYFWQGCRDQNLRRDQNTLIVNWVRVLNARRGQKWLFRNNEYNVKQRFLTQKEN